MKVTITHNTAKNGIEVKFDSKPEEVLRDWLKSLKFRYSRGQNLWYMKYSRILMAHVEEHLGAKAGINDGTGEVPAIPGITREDANVEAAS
jgi:hypothetical protein